MPIKIILIVLLFISFGTNVALYNGYLRANADKDYAVKRTNADRDYMVKRVIEIADSTMNEYENQAYAAMKIAVYLKKQRDSVIKGYKLAHEDNFGK